MHCLYVSACTVLGSYKRLSQPLQPLKLELQTTVRNQILATSTVPFLIILNILNCFDGKINHFLNSKSWSKICSVINVLSHSILAPLSRLCCPSEPSHSACTTVETPTKNKSFLLHETEAINFVSFLQFL